MFSSTRAVANPEVRPVAAVGSRVVATAEAKRAEAKAGANAEEAEAKAAATALTALIESPSCSFNFSTRQTRRNSESAVHHAVFSEMSKALLNEVGNFI